MVLASAICASMVSKAPKYLIVAFSWRNVVHTFKCMSLSLPNVSKLIPFSSESSTYAAHVSQVVAESLTLAKIACCNRTYCSGMTSRHHGRLCAIRMSWLLSVCTPCPSRQLTRKLWPSCHTVSGGIVASWSSSCSLCSLCCTMCLTRAHCISSSLALTQSICVTTSRILAPGTRSCNESIQLVTISKICCSLDASAVSGTARHTNIYSARDTRKNWFVRAYTACPARSLIANCKPCASSSRSQYLRSIPTVRLSS
mmetsp:Transcript_53107/g.85962  ORF Transcript_53107/g.85962 Transcript_53107/m.85962 type:complete len:256 (-) Transcript_53107:442-1209(-)